MEPILPLLTTPAARPWQRLLLFALWLAAAGWLASRHVFWRDEVRAFSLALSGNSVVGMLRGLQGEGHPALWYLLLRAVHMLVGHAALPLTALAVGVAAAGLWAWRAPFRWPVIAATLFGAWLVYEYTVSARNYGIAALLLFAFAALYPRYKAQGSWPGLVLALLCNTNAPTVMLAGALSLFWAVEVLTADGWQWTPRWRHWLGNMAVAATGVVLCVVTIYPPYNDAAVSPVQGPIGVGTIALAAVNLAQPFSQLLPGAWWSLPGATLLLLAMVVGSALGLVRSPGGLVAALLAAWALPLFFQLIYVGGYRHQALYIAFLLTLYWLVAEGGGGRWRDRRPVLRPAVQALLRRVGQGALALLLLAQVATAITLAAATANGAVNSRVADLGALIRRERLEQAVVIAHPDVLLEALPYYAANPIWLTRERKWGRVVAFTKAAKRQVTLAEMLATARALHDRTGRPVLVVLQVRLDPAGPPRTYDGGYLGDFSTTPADVRAFLAATTRIARFGEALTDESYDVYRLD